MVQESSSRPAFSGYPDECRARFRPERVLGEGGLGRVFLATEVSLERPVAIKVLSSTGDEESLARFRAEAPATAALAHAGIVQVIDHGVDRGVPWIAYEYLDGESLRARLARGPLPARDALEVGVQIADALELGCASYHEETLVAISGLPSALPYHQGWGRELVPAA